MREYRYEQLCGLPQIAFHDWYFNNRFTIDHRQEILKGEI
jgi:hypothetical protein